MLHEHAYAYTHQLQLWRHVPASAQYVRLSTVSCYSMHKRELVAAHRLHSANAEQQVLHQMSIGMRAFSSKHEAPTSYVTT